MLPVHDVQPTRQLSALFLRGGNRPFSVAIEVCHSQSEPETVGLRVLYGAESALCSMYEIRKAGGASGPQVAGYPVLKLRGLNSNVWKFLECYVYFKARYNIPTHHKTAVLNTPPGRLRTLHCVLRRRDSPLCCRLHGGKGNKSTPGSRTNFALGHTRSFVLPLCGGQY